MTLYRLMRITALLLISVLLGNNFAYAASKPVDAAQIKAKIEARGVGQGVRVKLVDNSEQKGLITNIGEQSFTLKPKKSSQPVELSYAQITGVHAGGLSTGQKVGIGVAIGVGIAAVTIAIVAAVFRHNFDKGFSKI
jgi:hypothetical protein